MLHAMQVSHTTGSIVFFTLLLIISAATIAYVIAWVGRKLLRRKEPRRSALARWTRRDVLGLAGGGIACIAWGGFMEPYRLEITRTRIVSPKLRGAKRPVRIVHISDLHCDPKIRNELKIPPLIASLSPDLIVYTGDSINSLGGLNNFQRCLTQIAKIAPTYASRGNWDTYFGDTDYFLDTGVIELNGANQRLEVAGAHLSIAGLQVLDTAEKDWTGHLEMRALLDPKERRLDMETKHALLSTKRLKATLDEMPEEDFKVFLYHYPDLIYSLAERNVDLHCAGHTHGGQVALPFYGALMTASQYGKRFEAGLYHVGNTHLYVNRGIGMEGRVPRVRFWSPPEISLIELAPPGSSATDEHG